VRRSYCWLPEEGGNSFLCAGSAVGEYADPADAVNERTDSGDAVNKCAGDQGASKSLKRKTIQVGWGIKTSRKGIHGGRFFCRAMSGGNYCNSSLVFWQARRRVAA